MPPPPSTTMRRAPQTEPPQAGRLRAGGLQAGTSLRVHPMWIGPGRVHPRWVGSRRVGPRWDGPRWVLSPRGRPRRQWPITATAGASLLPPPFLLVHSGHAGRPCGGRHQPDTHHRGKRLAHLGRRLDQPLPSGAGGGGRWWSCRRWSPPWYAPPRPRATRPGTAGGLRCSEGGGQQGGGRAARARNLAATERTECGRVQGVGHCRAPPLARRGRFYRRPTCVPRLLSWLPLTHGEMAVSGTDWTVA